MGDLYKGQAEFQSQIIVQRCECGHAGTFPWVYPDSNVLVCWFPGGDKYTNWSIYICQGVTQSMKMCILMCPCLSPLNSNSSISFVP